MTSAMLAALAGVNSVSGPGMLDFVLTFSLPKLVFDNEVCGQCLNFVRETHVLEDLPSRSLVDEVRAERSPHHLAAHAQVLAAGAVPDGPGHRPRESRDLDQAGLEGPAGARRRTGREAACGLCADPDRSRGGRRDAPHDPRGPEGPEGAAGAAAAARARRRARPRRRAPPHGAPAAGHRPQRVLASRVPDERPATGTAGPARCRSTRCATSA